MDLKTKDLRQLATFKSIHLALAPLEHSTSSVTGNFIGISFDAADLINDLECCGNIMRIDCNFGHKVNAAWVNDPLMLKSINKKIVKPPAGIQRKMQGDGTSFNSQISFVMRGSHACPKSAMGESHSSAIVVDLGNNMELVTKLYKIKVFCNGAISIPGVLMEQMEDIIPSLNELCDYLVKALWLNGTVHKAVLSPIMKNYKTLLSSGGINIPELQLYCEKHFNNLTNTRMPDIMEYLCCPAFANGRENQPIFNGWNNWLEMAAELELGPICGDNAVEINKKMSIGRIDGHQLRRFISASNRPKNLFINIAHLINEIEAACPQFVAIYRKLHIIYESMATKCQIIGDHIYSRIVYFAIRDWALRIKTKLDSERENLLSHFKYDPEKYSGFIIKVKTPNVADDNKRTTIKIFPSGKINIDGATSRADAEYIYWWLNSIFATNPRLSFADVLANYNDTDSEFSDDSM